MFTYIIDLFSCFRRWYIRAFLKKAPIPVFDTSGKCTDTFYCPVCTLKISGVSDMYCSCCGVKFNWVDLFGF